MSDPMESPTGAVELGLLPELLGYVLRRAQLAVYQDFHRSMASLDLRPTQYSVLHVIQCTPGLRPSQVAEALDIKRANFVALLGELEGAGLVERRRDPQDGRAFTLHLLAEGEELLHKADRQVGAHERRLAGRLEQGGAEHLLRLLGQLAAAE